MVLTKLKAVVDKQREQLRELQRNEVQKNLDSEAVSGIE